MKTAPLLLYTPFSVCPGSHPNSPSQSPYFCSYLLSLQYYWRLPLHCPLPSRTQAHLKISLQKLTVFTPYFFQLLSHYLTSSHSTTPQRVIYLHCLHFSAYDSTLSNVLLKSDFLPYNSTEITLFKGNHDLRLTITVSNSLTSPYSNSSHGWPHVLYGILSSFM